jgi:hypothetical protein
MRITLAVLASSLLLTPATGSGLGPTVGAIDAAKLLTDWCVATDAKADIAQKRIVALGLPSTAVQKSPIAGGTSMRVALGATAYVTLELEPAGKVRSCNLDVQISQPEATFAALQKQYFVGGNIDDYEPGHNTWFEIVSPRKVALAAIVTFQVSTTLSGERIGRMTAVVMPAAKPAGQ